MRIIILIITSLIAGIPSVFAAQFSLPTTIPTVSHGFVKTATTNKTVNSPSRGMTMKKVTRLYGEPVRKMPSTGKPPITRWVYDQFTVYFEGNYVIHAVINNDVTQTQATAN
jgi:hypothetical protein